MGEVSSNQTPLGTQDFDASVVAELVAAKEYHRVAAEAVKFWSIQAVAASLLCDPKERVRTFALFGIQAPHGENFKHIHATQAAIEILDKYKESQFDPEYPQIFKYKQTNTLHNLFTLPHIKGHIAYGNGNFYEASEIRKNLREALANRDAAGKKVTDATANYIRIKDLLASKDVADLYAQEQARLDLRNQRRNKETPERRQMRMRRLAWQAIALRVHAEKINNPQGLKGIDDSVDFHRTRPHTPTKKEKSQHIKHAFFSKAYWSKKLDLLSAGRYFSIVLSAVFGYQAFSYSAVTLLDLGAGVASYFFPLVFGFLAVQNLYQAFKKRHDGPAARKHFAKAIGFLILGALGFTAMMLSFGTGAYLIAGVIGVATFVGNLMVLVKYIPALLHKTFGKRFGKVSPTNTFVHDYENGVRLGIKRKAAILLGIFLCLTAGFVYGAIGYMSVIYSPIPNLFFAWFTFAITFIGICGLGLQNIKLELFARDFKHWKERWGVLFEQHFDTWPRKLFLAVTLAAGLGLGVAFTTFAALPLMTMLMPAAVAYTLIVATVAGKTAFYARNICFGAAEVLEYFFPRKNKKIDTEINILAAPPVEEQPVSENMENAKQSLRVINALGVGATAYVGGGDTGILLSSTAGVAAAFSSWATAAKEIAPNSKHKTTTVLYDNMTKESVETAEHPPTESTQSVAEIAQEAHVLRCAEQIKLVENYKAARPGRQ